MAKQGQEKKQYGDTSIPDKGAHHFYFSTKDNNEEEKESITQRDSPYKDWKVFNIGDEEGKAQ